MCNNIHQIKPILCLPWVSSAFINTHPAEWTQSDIEEFAEFCLAMALHCVAPDLKDPPVNREPYEILGFLLDYLNLVFMEEFLQFKNSTDQLLQNFTLQQFPVMPFPGTIVT